MEVVRYGGAAVEVSTGEVLEGEVLGPGDLPGFGKPEGERTLDDRVSAIISLLQDVNEKKWEIARELGSIERSWGTGELEWAASQCKMGRSQAYAYAKVWRYFGHLGEADRPANLFFTHYVIASRAPDAERGLELLHHAADEDLTTRPFDYHVQDLREKEGWDRRLEARPDRPSPRGEPPQGAPAAAPDATGEGDAPPVPSEKAMAKVEEMEAQRCPTCHQIMPVETEPR